MSAAPVYIPEPSKRRRVENPAPQRRRRPTPRRRPSGLPIALTILFVVVATVTFGFSSLVGHSVKEQSRRESIRTGERARAARADVARLRNRVEKLTTMRSVDEWAKTKGFVPSYQVASVAKKKPIDRVVVAKVSKSAPKLSFDVSVVKAESDEPVQ